MDKKKIYSAASLIVFIIFMVGGTVFLWRYISEFGTNPEAFKSAVEAYGEGNTSIIFVILQILQIIFPIIPGEIIEVAAGYIFGPFIGLLLCELGILIASVPIFFISRGLGNRVITKIFSKEKINSLSFLQNERRLTLVVFLLFFIPGTPKDLLTYFMGLTPIKPGHFIIITLFARIPSILTSTFAGASMGEGKLAAGLIIYGVTAAVSGAGILIYRRYTRKGN